MTDDDIVRKVTRYSESRPADLRFGSDPFKTLLTDDNLLINPLGYYESEQLIKSLGRII